MVKVQYRAISIISFQNNLPSTFEIELLGSGAFDE